MRQFVCLIAEDNSVERDGLRFLIERRAYPLRVLEASDGEKALAVMEREAVDILITDIRMPFMGGIELAQEIRRRGLTTQILICSAYGEFTYAQQAIACGASGYLLKPVQMREFYAQMDKILSELNSTSEAEKQRTPDREKCWFDVIHAVHADAGERAALAQSGVDIDAVRPVLLLLKFASEEIGQNAAAIRRALTGIVEGMWVLDEFRALMLLPETYLRDENGQKALADKVRAAVRSVTQAQPAILLYQPENGIGGLGNAWHILERQSELRLFRPGSLHNASSLSGIGDEEVLAHMNRLIDQAGEALSRNDSSAAYACMEELTECMRLFESVSAFCIRYAALRAVTLLTGNAGDTAQELLRCIASANDIPRITQIVEMHMNSLIRENHAVGRSAVEKIVARIQTSYMEPMTLETLSKGVHMAPAYVSSLFRKEMGITLIKYLTECRMKHAAELLENSDMSISDIMSAVGYDNISYFGMLFKTGYGLSPTQYRRARRGGGKK